MKNMTLYISTVNSHPPNKIMDILAVPVVPMLREIVKGLTQAEYFNHNTENAGERSYTCFRTSKFQIIEV